MFDDARRRRSPHALEADRRNHADGARRAQIALHDELKRPFVGVQRRPVHAIGQDHPICAHRRISSREIERDLVAVARLDDDDIGEFYAANCFAGGSADFRQHVAEQRALKNMRCPMLIRADFDSRKRVKFGDGQGGLLAVESPPAPRSKSCPRRRRRRLRAK